MAEPKTIAHAFLSHSTFNERLAQRQTPKPRDLSGPWLSNEAVANLPRVRRAFDLNRDPSIARQIRDAEGAESQRAGRGSTMVREESTLPAPHPTGPDAEAVDRDAFRERWLAEQRDAVMAQARERPSSPEPGQEMARVSKVPSR